MISFSHGKKFKIACDEKYMRGKKEIAVIDFRNRKKEVIETSKGRIYI